MGIFFFAVFLCFATFNVIFLLTKLRDRENQRKKFEEIDRFKAEQRALGNPQDHQIEENPQEDFSQLRKDKIHIWKD